MDQAWPELPSAVFVPLVGLLNSIEIKSLRSVCKNWRQDVDAALSNLTPRSMNDAESRKKACIESRHLQLLDLQACKMLYSLLSLEVLDCSCLVGPSHTHLRIIASLPRLKHLVIRGNYQSNDVSLAIVARLTRLTCLRFNHAKALTDEGLSALSALIELQVLELRGADSLHGGGLSSLLSVPGLRSLSMMECFNLDERGLQAIALLTGLISLDLSGCTIDRFAESLDPTARESFIQLVSQLTNLQVLNVSDGGCLTGDWLPPHLSQLCAITRLDIGDRKNSLSHSEGLSHLCGLQTLQWLSLAGLGPCHGSSLRHLTKLRSLKYLNMSIYQLQDKHIWIICRLSSLKTLIMMRCPRVSESHFASIGRRLPHLESLQLSVCDVRLNSLRTFPDNPIASSIREIIFMECERVTNRIGSVLAEFPKLSRLVLSYNHFVDGSIATSLSHLTGLLLLDLSNCEAASDENVIHLGSLTTLQSLDLSGTRVGLGISALRTLTKLTFLGLGCTHLSNRGLEALGYLLNLRTLVANDTQITDEGLRHLGGMTALQKLHVRGTAVTESGILEALMPLALNHSLAKIIVPRSVSEEVADYMPCTQILL